MASQSRYAMVVVVEAESAELAHESVLVTLTCQKVDEHQLVLVSPAAEIRDAEDEV